MQIKLKPFIILVLAACGLATGYGQEAHPDSGGSPTTIPKNTVVDIGKAGLAAPPEQVPRQVLEMTEALLDYRIDILKQAIHDFRGLQSQCAANPLFCNPINQTLEQLQKDYEAVNGFGTLILPGTLEQAEVPCAPGREYQTYRSKDYWMQMGSSLANYGFLESRKLTTSEHVLPHLFAKGFFVDSFPDDVLLIEGGDWRGFFMKTNGDVIIPGKRFYDDVFSGRRPVASMRKTPDYSSTIEALKNAGTKPSAVSSGNGESAQTSELAPKSSTSSEPTSSDKDVKVNVKDSEDEKQLRQLVDRIGRAHIAKFVIQPVKSGTLRKILGGPILCRARPLALHHALPVHARLSIFPSVPSLPF